MLCACSSSSRNLLSPGFWDIRCNRQSFLGHFLPFDPHNNPKYQNFEKMNMMNMNMVIRCMVPEILSVTHNCLPFLGYFCPFTPLIIWKIKILKKWEKKKCLEISSFYTFVPQMTIIWCMVPEIWSRTDTFFFHFKLFFALLTH